MWLFTTSGFFSVVAARGGEGLVVRARVRKDLEELRARYAPELTATEESAATDYRYRARIGHEAFGAALARVTADLRYGNFKEEVEKVQGAMRERVYEDVWRTLDQKLPGLDHVAVPRGERLWAPYEPGTRQMLIDANGDDDAEVVTSPFGYPAPFVAMPPRAQVEQVWQLLVSMGACEEAQAVDDVLFDLNTIGRVARRGEAATRAAIKRAIARGVKQGRFDRPAKGQVRALMTREELAPRGAVFVGWFLGPTPRPEEEIIGAAREAAQEALGLALTRRQAERLVHAELERALLDGRARKLDDGRYVWGWGREPDPDSIQVTHATEPRVLDAEESMLVLQTSPPSPELGGMTIERVVTNVVIVGWTLSRMMPRQGRDWIAALALDRAHVGGLSLWLGLSAWVPPPVVEKIAELLGSWSKAPVQRELAPLGRHELFPLAVLSADGLEVPPIASSAIDDEDLESMGVVRATRRPMRIAGD